LLKPRYTLKAAGVDDFVLGLTSIFNIFGILVIINIDVDPRNLLKLPDLFGTKSFLIWKKETPVAVLTPHPSSVSSNKGC
jgi:hypothetical protein